MKKFVLAAAIAALSSTGAFAQGTESVVVGGTTGGTVGGGLGLGLGAGGLGTIGVVGGLLGSLIIVGIIADSGSGSTTN